jgi:hypothetical protein
MSAPNEALVLVLGDPEARIVVITRPATDVSFGSHCARAAEAAFRELENDGRLVAIVCRETEEVLSAMVGADPGNGSDLLTRVRSMAGRALNDRGLAKCELGLCTIDEDLQGRLRKHLSEAHARSYDTESGRVFVLMSTWRAHHPDVASGSQPYV